MKHQPVGRILLQRMPLKVAVLNDLPGAVRALLTAHHVARGGHSEEGNCCALCSGTWSLDRAPVSFILGRQVDPDLDEAHVLLLCEECAIAPRSSDRLLAKVEGMFGWSHFAPLPDGGRA